MAHKVKTFIKKFDLLDIPCVFIVLSKIVLTLVRFGWIF